MPFLEAGVQAVDIIDLDYPAWHTADDTLEQTSARSLETVGKVVQGAWGAIEARLCGKTQTTEGTEEALGGRRNTVAFLCVSRQISVLGVAPARRRREIANVGNANHRFGSGLRFPTFAGLCVGRHAPIAGNA